MAVSERWRHLRMDERAEAEDFTSPRQGRDRLDLPRRDRHPHGTDLISKLDDAEAQARAEQEGADSAPGGVTLVFQSDPDFALALKSLEASRQGIELLNVRVVGKRSLASVYIPNGQLIYFKNKFEKYLTEVTPVKGEPKNKKLIESISDIQYQAINAFWTELGVPLPADGTFVNWEIWLRVQTDPEPILNIFRVEAEHRGLKVGPRVIRFPERVVTLAHGTVEQIRSSWILLDMIAELRLAKECPTTFIDMAPYEQAEWVRETVGRLKPPPGDAGAVCILDTGVNNGHPLLAPALHTDHVLTCFPRSPKADLIGHGTEMAGLALYGDLAAVLTSSLPVELEHRLEAVKIHPEADRPHPDLYGAVCLQAASMIEKISPDRRRVYCMAITANDNRDRGRPTSWSGELDRITYGVPEMPQRLFFVAAGNVPTERRADYPAVNEVSSIHDPGQAWNIVTVGAHTDRTVIQTPAYDGFQPLASIGELSPCSTTSMVWLEQWPLKPEITMEGGNTALDPAFNEPSMIEDLMLLSTSSKPTRSSFVSTGQTSGATALASRMGATIQAKYLDYWPETIRALMIHSAEWTPAMWARFPGPSKAACHKRLRCYGYGAPDLDRALWCGRNSLCLISQAEIQPFHKVGNDIKSKDMHFYKLPWPVDELKDLGPTLVTMRVTLSYFIEPSPGERGRKKPHRYHSYGLRFEVQQPTDTMEEFQWRMNKNAQDEEDDKPGKADTSGWTLGSRLRTRGSIHSDWWTGTASALADSRHLGIYPVSGWWRERPRFGRWARKVRYSLIVSITTPESEIDIYSPVRVQLATPIPIEIEPEDPLL
jgi:Subtilase family